MSKLEESAFQLSTKELKQIRYLELLKKRKLEVGKSKRFSDKMSVEAQIAMQLAMEDTQKIKDIQTISDGVKVIKTNKCESDVKQRSGHECEVNSETEFDDKSTPSSGRKSYAELYENRGIVRMQNDITDETFNPQNQSRRPLDTHAKLESAMEIIENVNHDDPLASILDDAIIEQIAQQNSVDKCSIWIEANS